MSDFLFRAALLSGQGLSDGDDILTSHTAPDAWDQITKANGGTFKYDTTYTDDAAEHVGTATNHASFAAITSWDVASIAGEFEYDGRAWPNVGDVRLLQCEDTSAGYAARVNISTAGKVKLYDAGGALKFTSTASVPTTPGSKYRIYLGVEPGTGTTDGTLDLRLYLDGDKDTSANETYTQTNVNAGTTNLRGIRHGFDTLGSNTAVYQALLVAQMNQTIGVIGPWYSTVVEGTDTPVAAATISGVTGGDGGPYTVAGVTQTGGTSIGTLSYSGLTFWGTAENVDACTFDVTVEDGSSNQVVQEVTIPAPSDGSPGVYVYDPDGGGVGVPAYV